MVSQGAVATIVGTHSFHPHENGHLFPPASRSATVRLCFFMKKRSKRGLGNTVLTMAKNWEGDDYSISLSEGSPECPCCPEAKTVEINPLVLVIL